MNNICPVCGFSKLYDPPYDEDGSGSFEICPCCGFQFGYDDYPHKKDSYIKWKENWDSKGNPWFSKKRKKH